MLDGLVGNAAQFDPLVHHVDTGGVSDHVFALFHLLGLSFAPRLRDFPHRRLACFGRPGRWKELAPLMGKPINEEVVLEHWNDALRLTASIKTVSVKPSAMLRKLGAYRQQNRLYLALGEIGRIERTLFMLEWMESPQLRMECKRVSTRVRPDMPSPVPCSRIPRAVSTTVLTTPSKTRHGAEPRHRRHRVLEHVIHREGRQPSAPRASAAGTRRCSGTSRRWDGSISC